MTRWSSTRWRATHERGNPQPGIIAAVVSFKDSGGGRWEWVGKVPKAAAYIMMTMCATPDNRQCYTLGQDAGIEAAFATQEAP